MEGLARSCGCPRGTELSRKRVVNVPSRSRIPGGMAGSSSSSSGFRMRLTRVRSSEVAGIVEIGEVGKYTELGGLRAVELSFTTTARVDW